MNVKVEGVYPMVYETFKYVVENLPHFIDEVYNKRSDVFQRRPLLAQGMP
jgi:hypothetical protein